MTCGLAHASYSLPEWHSVKLTFFALCYYNVFYKQFDRNEHFLLLNLVRLELRSASVQPVCSTK